MKFKLLIILLLFVTNFIQSQEIVNQINSVSLASKIEGILIGSAIGDVAGAPDGYGVSHHKNWQKRRENARPKEIFFKNINYLLNDLKFKGNVYYK